MKVRVLATAPFAFPLKGETLYFFTAGESTIMETSDPESRKQLIEMLSPEYVDYLHVDRDSLPKDLLEEVQQSTVGVPVEQPEVIPNYSSEDKVIIPSPLEEPAQEPAPFVEQEPVVENPVHPIPVEEVVNSDVVTDPIAPVVEAPLPEVVEVVEEEPANPEPELTPEVEPKEEEQKPEDKTIDQLLEEAIAARKAELDELHWTQLREIAEGHSIEYTNKAEVIEAVLKKEFED